MDLTKFSVILRLVLIIIDKFKPCKKDKADAP